MKAVFIVYNQALTEAVNSILEQNHIRGYSKWVDVQGRGSHGGEPHFGTHVWPAMNSAIIAIIEEERVEHLMENLKQLDLKTKQQGLRAFVWSVEGMV